MIDVATFVRYPPFVCRVLARKTVQQNGKRTVIPVSTMEIVAISGLSAKKVVWIGSQPNWDDITVGEAIRFLKGCHLIDRPVWRCRWFLVRAFAKPNALRHLDKLPKDDRRRVCDAYTKYQAKWIEEMQKL
jgi:hypothetical protein